MLSLLVMPAMLALALAQAIPAAPAVKKPKPPKPPKVHIVALGAGKKVPYTRQGDPAGASAEDKELHVRPLVVDGKIKEWTAGEQHDVTDRSFAVRRVIRLNDALPTDKVEHWVWQRGPWLLVDRANGHITALKLPDYDPAVSEVAWFRDLAAYCGLNTSRKQLFAVVAQVSARKPLIAKKLASWDPAQQASSACAPAAWQREPLRVTFQPTGSAAESFDLSGSSAVLVEDGDVEPEKPTP